MNNLQKLKTESFFWTPKLRGIWNEISGAQWENKSYDKHIIDLTHDLKVLEQLRINNSFDCSGLSKYTLCTYVLIADKDYSSAISMTRNSIEKYKNIKYYYERASKFLNMTGNLKVDVASIKALEEIRYMLFNGEATLEEVEQILPKNFKRF